MMCLHIKPNNFTTENWLNRLLTNILGVEQWFLVWYMLFKVTSVSSTWSMFRATNPQQNYKNVCVCAGGGVSFCDFAVFPKMKRMKLKKKKRNHLDPIKVEWQAVLRNFLKQDCSHSFWGMEKTLELLCTPTTKGLFSRRLPNLNNILNILFMRNYIFLRHWPKGYLIQK